ncbi:MAG: hypothetical protein D6768_16415, partial [Chloroflexi bacterium]
MPVINFDVNIIYPTPTAAPVMLNTAPVTTTTLTSTVPISSTTNPAQSPQLTGTPAITPPNTINPADGFTPDSPPLATPAAVVTQAVTPAPALTETTTATQTVTTENTLTATTSLPQPASPVGPFVLLEPFQGFVLQPGINELEFKWRWAGKKNCQPPEGFGYELRIWPAVTGYGPMGVTDAVANQQAFFCDAKSNVASYRVDDLKGTPGVSAMGAGKYLWDVAYIQLDPYTVV